MELFDEASEGKSTEGSAGIGRRVSSPKGRSSRSRKTGKSAGPRNRKMGRSGHAKIRAPGRTRDGRRSGGSAEQTSVRSPEAVLDAPDSGLSDPEEPRKEPPSTSPTSFNLSMGGDDDDLVEYVY